MSSDWNNWIKSAVSNEYIKYFDYNHFRDIKEIGSGGFGKIYYANWKNSEQRLVLKSLLNIDHIAAKELVYELKLHRKVDFHDNIIHFCGLTQDDNSKKYMLVMEYADGGTLENYLTNNFLNLSWKNKYNLAFQLASAVLCIHDEGIIHCDLHSGNVLVRNDTVKLADFGLSKRIDDSRTSAELFGVVPYIDPKRFGNGKTRRSSVKGKNNENKKQVYRLNEKSDVYAVGVLLWVISSGQKPFCDMKYDATLAIEISKGYREKPISHTPNEYIDIYTECWNGAPEKRPTMQQVIARLKAITSKTAVKSENTQSDSSLHGELSSLMDNFENMEFDSNVGNSSSVSISIETIEKVVGILSTINDADEVVKMIVPFPPQITAEEILDRSKAKERKKAPNNFMIYRMAYIKELKTRNLSSINPNNISVLAASKWAKESDEVKRAYKDISDEVQSKLDEHIRTSKIFA